MPSYCIITSIPSSSSSSSDTADSRCAVRCAPAYTSCVASPPTRARTASVEPWNSGRRRSAGGTPAAGSGEAATWAVMGTGGKRRRRRTCRVGAARAHASALPAVVRFKAPTLHEAHACRTRHGAEASGAAQPQQHGKHTQQRRQRYVGFCESKGQAGEGVGELEGRRAPPRLLLPAGCARAAPLLECRPLLPRRRHARRACAENLEGSCAPRHRPVRMEAKVATPARQKSAAASARVCASSTSPTPVHRGTTLICKEGREGQRSGGGEQSGPRSCWDHGAHCPRQCSGPLWITKHQQAGRTTSHECSWPATRNDWTR